MPITDKEFLETELKMGVSLSNPQFVALGRATAQQLDGLIEKVHTVLDYGAGVGAYAKGFHDEGYEVSIYEKFQAHKDYLTEHLSYIPVVSELPYKVDLLVWIEVAEHMTDAEINELLTHTKAKYILFSSTSERTDNDEKWGHINIKTQEQWYNVLGRYGYTLLKELDTPTPWTKLFQNEELT